jgi:hypothetical protein
MTRSWPCQARVRLGAGRPRSGSCHEACGSVLALAGGGASGEGKRCCPFLWGPGSRGQIYLVAGYVAAMPDNKRLMAFGRKSPDGRDARVVLHTSAGAANRIT